MKILLFLSLAFTMVACDSDEHKKNEESSNSWIQDELLLQMDTLRKELILLKNKTKTIEEKLESHLSGKKAVMPNKLSLREAESLGDKNTSFAIIEFSDFQCPYCARHDKQVFPELKKKYIDTGKLQYMARDYPLGFHKQAPAAAMAAHCAGDQDQYWPMRHKLFSGGSLNPDRFKKDALALNLDMKLLQLLSYKKIKTVPNTKN